MSTPNQITMPTLAPDATLKLTDPRPTADATFTTRKGRPVDAVCVDHAVVETGKGTPAVRLLFVVVSGQDANDADVAGQNIVTDKYLSPGAAPYTFADLRLMGWDVADGKEDAALEALAGGDLKKSGLGGKLTRVDLKSDTFNNAPTVRVAGISQPPQRLDAKEVKGKLATASILDAIKKSKDGRPKAEGSDGGSGSNRAPRNPTSPPPARDGLAPNPATDGDMTF